MILVGEMRDLETISHRADRGRDRPPRLRHAAHAERAADDRPHHRRLPGPPAGPGPRAALGRPQGVMTQQLLPTADGSGRVVACEVLVPDARPCATSSARARPTRSRRRCRPARSVGMQTMDAALAGARPRRQDHPAPRRAALLDARGAAPPAGLRRQLRRRRLIAWPPTSSRRWTSPGRRPPARSRPTSKQVVADQLKAARPDRPRHRGQARLEGDHARLPASGSSRPT